MAHHVDAKRMLDERGYEGRTIHDQNPAHLLEKAVRDRITDSYYWKEQCFAINEATLCDRAVAVSHLGGTYGQQKPTAFLCLTLKLLQLLPDRDVVLEYLYQEDFKYLSALAAFYVRLTFDAVDVYRTLEPLLGDYRRLRRRTREGGYVLTFMDQFVDDLLTKERVCGTSLRKLPRRALLEDLGQLEERASPLGEEIEEIDRESEEEERGGARSGSGSGSGSGSEVEVVSAGVNGAGAGHDESD
ncbi:hypothetical protein MMC34_006258 [Xylographa carneopallida]|nr:hypothetical protein [Xylographa carneopallida]